MMKAADGEADITFNLKYFLNPRPPEQVIRNLISTLIYFSAWFNVNVLTFWPNFPPQSQIKI